MGLRKAKAVGGGNRVTGLKSKKPKHIQRSFSTQKVPRHDPVPNLLGPSTGAKPKTRMALVPRGRPLKLSYTPVNLTVYTAAYAGCIAGFGAGGRWLVDSASADYASFATIAGTFAAAFDEAWAINPDTNPPNTLQVQIIQSECEGAWAARFTSLDAETMSTSTFTEFVESLIALILASAAYFTSQGITPLPWPSGSSSDISVVLGGTGIHVDTVGTVATVSNTGVLSNIAGTGIGVSGATGNVTISNTGVLALTAGTNVTITGTASNPIINSSNSGGTLTGITAGTGISVTGSAPSPTVNNTGVLSAIAGTGIGVSGATGNVTFSNTGVLGVTAGTNVTITGTSQNPIINATSSGTLTGITAGTGISVTGGAPSPTVSNTGVLTVTAGAGITIGGTAQNPTVAYNGTVGSASVGLASARPVATGSGKIYFCTDVPVMYVDDPTQVAWIQFNVVPVPKGPSAASYTMSGSLGITQYADAIWAGIADQAANIYATALTAGSLPQAGAWIVSLTCTFLAPPTQFPGIGVCVSNGTTSGTSTLYQVGLYSDQTVSTGAHIQATSATVGGDLLSSLTSNLDFFPQSSNSEQFHFRLLNDGVNLHFQYGEGFNFLDIYTLATPAGLTDYGFFLGGSHGSTNARCMAIIMSNPLTGLTVPQSNISNIGTGATGTVTTSTPHGLHTGDWVAIHGVTGTGGANTSAGAGFGTGATTVSVLSPTTFQMPNAALTGTYTGGGVVTCVSR